MSNIVQSELNDFNANCLILNQSDRYLTNSPIEHTISISPPELAAKPDQKDYALTIMAITHGNEVAGLRVVNHFLKMIITDVIKVKVPICVVLGNPDASQAGLRYLERDLNRSFQHEDDSFKEVRRAAEIESILDKTFLLLDIHQTKENSESPFFIFPYSPAGFSFAKMISEDIPVVTHWGKPFSSEGMCTDEYTNTKGGCGITLEIGQNGFHPFHVGVGFHGCLRSLEIAGNHWQSGQLPQKDFSRVANSNTFTFSQIIPYPEQGEVKLAQGFNNFSMVSENQVIGSIGGQELQAKQSGPVLFPQYMRHGEKIRPAELIRILREIELSELPH